MDLQLFCDKLKKIEKEMGKEIVSVEIEEGVTISKLKKLTFMPKMATPEALAELFKNIDKP